MRNETQVVLAFPWAGLALLRGGAMLARMNTGETSQAPPPGLLDRLSARIDPLTRMDDDCPIYHFFRERRLRTRKRGHRFRALTEWYLARVDRIRQATSPLLPMVKTIGIGADVAKILKYMEVARGFRCVEEAVLPPTIGEAFRWRRVDMRCARELHACGVGGGEILKAMMLELRDERRRRIRWMPVVLTTLALVIALPETLLHMGLLAPALFLAGLVGFLGSYLIFAFPTGYTRLLNNRIKDWTRTALPAIRPEAIAALPMSHPVRESLGRLVRLHPLAGLYVNMASRAAWPAVAINVVVQGFNQLIQYWARSGAFTSLWWFLAEHGILLVGVIVAALGIMVIGTRPFRPDVVAGLPPILAQADESFALFMACVVEGDPDGWRMLDSSGSGD